MWRHSGCTCTAAWSGGSSQHLLHQCLRSGIVQRTGSSPTRVDGQLPPVRRTSTPWETKKKGADRARCAHPEDPKGTKSTVVVQCQECPRVPRVPKNA
eukprot:7382830-Prymnesium_polylepis.1